jgi:membrane protease YdiL (CAAX protease family)
MIVQNFKYYKNEMLKVFIIVFSVFLIFLIFTPFGGEKDISNNQSKLLEIFKNYPFSASVQTIIVAPIIEEILYRYLIFRFINNPFHATIFSAFFFASAHVFSSFD